MSIKASGYGSVDGAQDEDLYLVTGCIHAHRIGGQFTSVDSSQGSAHPGVDHIERKKQKEKDKAPDEV